MTSFVGVLKLSLRSIFLFFFLVGSNLSLFDQKKKTCVIVDAPQPRHCIFSVEILLKHF